MSPLRLPPGKSTFDLQIQQDWYTFSMLQSIPHLLSALFFALSFIHIYWAFGGQIGLRKVIPLNQNGEPLFTPGPLITIIVATLLALVGFYFICGAFGLHDFRGAMAYPAWVVAVLFLARAIGDFRYIGFLKRIGGSDFARMDTLLYSPLCLLISGLIVLYQYDRF